MAQQSSGEFASANPTKGEEDARVQERGIGAKISLNAAAAHNTFNVQRHLTSARTHRAFRASALQTWREIVAAA
jgi:putative transposase